MEGSLFGEGPESAAIFLRASKPGLGEAPSLATISE